MSARTIRVRLAFSITKRVLPSCPAIRPTARERWSPWSVLTSLTSNDSWRGKGGGGGLEVRADGEEKEWTRRRNARRRAPRDGEVRLRLRR